MRRSCFIVSGVFCGATIEPGTFHKLLLPPGSFCCPSVGKASDGQRHDEVAATGTPLTLAQVRSAAGEETALISPNVKRSVSATID